MVCVRLDNSILRRNSINIVSSLVCCLVDFGGAGHAGMDKVRGGEGGEAPRAGISALLSPPPDRQREGMHVDCLLSDFLFFTRILATSPSPASNQPHRKTGFDFIHEWITATSGHFCLTANLDQCWESKGLYFPVIYIQVQFQASEGLMLHTYAHNLESIL